MSGIRHSVTSSPEELFRCALVSKALAATTQRYVQQRYCAKGLAGTFLPSSYSGREASSTMLAYRPIAHGPPADRADSAEGVRHDLPASSSASSQLLMIDLLSDPFSDILALAKDADAIRTYPFRASDPGRSDGRSHSCLTDVPAGQPVVFRCAVPTAMGAVQALMFERDAAGSVALLSHSVLLGGDLWYRDEITVPRTDALLSRAGAPARISLVVPGLSTLLVICCRGHGVRLDKLPLFNKTAIWPAPGPVETEPVTAQDLRTLHELLRHLPAISWTALAGSIRVRGLPPPFPTP